MQVCKHRVRVRGSLIVVSTVLGILLGAGPAKTLAREKPHRAPGTHKLAMVVQVAGSDEILATGDEGILGRMRAEGIRDEDILRDGSVAVGIVYCCGGSISMKTRLMFYVPPGLTLAAGDVVEIELGREANKKQKDPGAINRAVARHESIEDEDGQCRWDPENDALWMRVLRCDWMESQGWLYEGGLDKTWYKAGE